LVKAGQAGLSTASAFFTGDYRHEGAARARQAAVPKKFVAAEWLDRHHNLLIIGPTGVGKS